MPDRSEGRVARVLAGLCGLGLVSMLAIGFLGQAGVPPLVTFSPLLPLFLLLFSGLFMFVQHYAHRRAGLNHV